VNSFRQRADIYIYAFVFAFLYWRQVFILAAITLCDKLKNGKLSRDNLGTTAICRATIWYFFKTASCRTARCRATSCRAASYRCTDLMPKSEMWKKNVEKFQTVEFV
jgi:hypothetical protein